jgi:hypothetical protein
VHASGQVWPFGEMLEIAAILSGLAGTLVRRAVLSKYLMSAGWHRG